MILVIFDENDINNNDIHMVLMMILIVYYIHLTVLINHNSKNVIKNYSKNKLRTMGRIMNMMMDIFIMCLYNNYG